MATRIKPVESHVKLQSPAPELPAGIRSGGEKRPLEYPHLYQIQAGDWRISYAVEHNRLAILVLEVVNADGEPVKDPARESLKKKMKVKLLDWPEGTGSTEIPPEVLSKKLKIKLLDLSEDVGEESGAEGSQGKSRIKLAAASDKKAGKQHPRAKGKITLLEGTEPPAAADGGVESEESENLEDADRKITPVDEPSM
jgi:mRNA-degrading endonuclease RelE of RelBE toxin-antitoxin system